MMSKKPFVMKNGIERWSAKNWTPEIFSTLAGDKTETVRFGTLTHIPGRIQWESECARSQLTVQQFLEWTEGKFALPYSDCKPETHWGYFDYKYLFDLVDPEYLQAIDWSVFGVEGSGVESTVWIGTKGAYTPCHYDTYGFNLHAQIFGRKRWILFPPEDLKYLRPTRIPYEESSVFSDVDILTAPECLQGTTPYLVTLDPGDVLYVPPYWWHSVQCIDTCISVNTWVPLDELDSKMRVSEALTRAIVGVINDSSIVDLTPNESVDGESTTDEMLHFLTSKLQSTGSEMFTARSVSNCSKSTDAAKDPSNCRQEVVETIKSTSNPSNRTDWSSDVLAVNTAECSNAKRPKLQSSTLDMFLSKNLTNRQEVSPLLLQELRETLEKGPLIWTGANSVQSDEKFRLKKKDLIRTLLDPEVVDLVSKKLGL